MVERRQVVGKRFGIVKGAGKGKPVLAQVVRKFLRGGHAETYAAQPFGIREHFGGRSQSELLAFLKYEYAVAVTCKIVHAVRHHDHGKTAFMQIGYELQELLSCVRVESGYGLVEHKNARVHGQNARERHTPLLASGKLEGAFLA